MIRESLKFIKTTDERNALSRDTVVGGCVRAILQDCLVTIRKIYCLHRFQLLVAKKLLITDYVVHNKLSAW